MSRRTRRDRRSDSRELVEEIKRNSQAILTMENIEKFVELSENFGQLCSRTDISTSQIRGIFQNVKRLPDDFEKSKKDLNLLRPKLAYQKGRFSQLTPLTEILTHLIKQVNNDLTLKGFKEFFEAILAYHKSYGGD
jgi:CRISPR-associated protein Csm2